MKLLHAVALVTLLVVMSGRANATMPSGEWFAGQTLVQEINCAGPSDVLFAEHPQDVSSIQRILDRDSRVLPAEGGAKYFAYRVGQGKGLRSGAAYVLAVDYPEDASRSVIVCNWGCETAMGFATGQAVGDVLRGRYVTTNPESINYPLSGAYQTWSQLFYLHDRTTDIKRPKGVTVRPLLPEDGFWVVIAHMPQRQDPLSAGAAVSRIRLYEVTDPAALEINAIPLPEDLPRRRIFSREEMPDAVIQMGHKPEEQDPRLRGVTDPVRWHEDKMRTIKFLGANTYSRDLLEFGHNQGWDSSGGGGDAWVNQPSRPWLWEKVVERAADLGLDVLPMYEYRGSFGQDPTQSLGRQKRAKTLGGNEAFTQIEWLERSNVDITDPQTLADACRIIDLTIGRYSDRANFAGAWFRNRPSSMPIGFGDATIERFIEEANDARAISRNDLQTDSELLQRYYAWWFTKRVAFFEQLAEHVRKSAGPNAVLLYTNDVSEPGQGLPRSITGAGQTVVTDDLATWNELLQDQQTFPGMEARSISDVVGQQMHLKALASWHQNWGGWEWNHAAPPDDPNNWVASDGLMLSYTYNRLYTVGDPKSMEAYRGKSGLALIRHHSLNENEFNIEKEEPIGYFVMDVERAGPFTMMAEARAVAFGDPVFLGSLTGNTHNRGFAEYVRRFNTAFLALPALPSEVLPDASSDAEVVVRRINTEKHGSYLAVVNTGMTSKQGVTIKVTAGERVDDAATGKPLAAPAGMLSIDLYPAELRAIRVHEAE